MTDRTIALVTGANKGIGYEIARQLGAAGHTVLLGSRDATRGEQAAATLAAGGATVEPVWLDVTDDATITAAAKWIEERYGRLDVLVNNAGIAVELDGTAPYELPVARLRQTFETNLFGAVAVTNAMVALLRRSAAPRVVNMSSDMASLARMSDPGSSFPQLLAYNTAKAALNMATVTYASTLRDSAIKVNAANPGYCATDLNGHAGPRTAAQGAAVAVHLATLPDDGPTGGFFEDGGPVPW